MPEINNTTVLHSGQFVCRNSGRLMQVNYDVSSPYAYCDCTEHKDKKFYLPLLVLQEVG